MLSEKQVDDFQKLYRAHFGKKLDRTEASIQATKLLRLMEIVYKPMTKAECDRLHNRREQTRDCVRSQ